MILAQRTCGRFTITSRPVFATRRTFYWRGPVRPFCRPRLLQFKNSRGEYVGVNHTLVTRCGLREKSDLMGRRADELFPKPFGESYRAQDESVLREGKAILNQLELHFCISGADAAGASPINCPCGTAITPGDRPRRNFQGPPVRHRTRRGLFGHRQSRAAHSEKFRRHLARERSCEARWSIGIPIRTTHPENFPAHRRAAHSEDPHGSCRATPARNRRPNRHRCLGLRLFRSKRLHPSISSDHRPLPVRIPHRLPHSKKVGDEVTSL